MANLRQGSEGAGRYYGALKRAFSKFIKRKSKKKSLLVLISLVVPTILGLSPSYPSYAAITYIPRMFQTTLSGAKIVWSPVTVGDLYGNGQTDIVVGGSDGMVYALGPSGNVLWSFSTADAINNNAGVSIRTGTSIRSAPTLADLNGDGCLEVIVSVGDVFEMNQNGGLVVISHDGKLMWVKAPPDSNGDGLLDGMVSTPAVADIDNDGQLEIIAGAFDQRVYAWHANGTPVAGWPVWIYDTIWSSPALADIDQDGYLEVVIGVDAANNDYYHLQQGGYTHVLKYNGTELAGWPQHQDEIIQSSPAVADLNNDGWLDIVVGTGTYYPGVGNYVSAYNHDGSLLWRAITGGQVFGSPAIGDINGDGALEVVVGCEDGNVYAFRGSDGHTLWVTRPYDKDNYNNPVRNPILADFNGDGKADVLIGMDWEVIPLRGYDGVQTNRYGQGVYYAGYTVAGTPAVADLDGDGKLELIAASAGSDGAHGMVYAWKLQNSSSSAPWPMFHRMGRHIGLYSASALEALPSSLNFIVPKGGSLTKLVKIDETIGGSLNWTVSSCPSWIIPNKTSGSTPDTLQLTVKGSYQVGTYTSGSVIISSGSNSQAIRVTFMEPVSSIYEPVIHKSYTGGY